MAPSAEWKCKENLDIKSECDNRLNFKEKRQCRFLLLAAIFNYDRLRKT